MQSVTVAETWVSSRGGELVHQVDCLGRNGQSKLRLFEGEWVTRVVGRKVLTRNTLRSFSFGRMKIL